MEVAQMLQTYGGWGTTVICLTVIWRMAAYIAKVHEEHRDEGKEAAAVQREETKATVTALVETRDALRAFKEAMVALAEKLKE